MTNVAPHNGTALRPDKPVYTKLEETRPYTWDSCNRLSFIYYGDFIISYLILVVPKFDCLSTCISSEFSKRTNFNITYLVVLHFECRINGSILLCLFLLIVFYLICSFTQRVESNWLQKSNENELIPCTFGISKIYSIQ